MMNCHNYLGKVISHNFGVVAVYAAH